MLHKNKFGLFVVAIIFLAISIPSSYASLSFGTATNLSNNAGVSTVPGIISSGNNAYVVWQDTTDDATGDVSYIASHDKGQTFAGIHNLSNSTGIASLNPVISANGTNVYAAWQEGNDVNFIKITNNGSSFGPVQSLSSLASAATSLQIASSGNNVYVVWRFSNDIWLDKSIDGGASFLGATNISNNVGASQLPVLAAYGSNVYLAWKDTTGLGFPNTDIFFKASTDNGTTFGGVVNLSSNAGASDTPTIAAAGNNAYVAWKDQSPGNTEVLFAASTNSGSSFVGLINSSNTTGISQDPQLVASGNNVYLVWDDTITPGPVPEIFFDKSSNQGSSFLGKINLSNNAGTSTIPRVAVSGNNIYVVWKDNSDNAANDIFFSSSTDGGSAFSNAIDLTNDANASDKPLVAISGSNAVLAWQHIAVNSAYDIFSNYGTPTTITVSFDQPQYKTTSSGIITVNDPVGNTDPAAIETVTPVVVNSTSDPTGISLVLHETGINTGIFTGPINFTTGSSSAGMLQTSANDTIQASFAGSSETAKIYPRTILFKSPSPGVSLSNIERGQIAHIIVNDQNSNLDVANVDSIHVGVKTNADPVGIDIILYETGPNTGVFGDTSDSVIFGGSNLFFPATGTITLSQEDSSANIDPAALDITSDDVNSTSDQALNSIFITETGINTGNFTGPLLLSSANSIAGSSIKVQPGDFIMVSHHGIQAATTSLITPNPNPSNGAILVNATGPDTATASYAGSSVSTVVTNIYSHGGSGGGLVRPGLILDVVASLGKGGNNPVPPMFSLFTIAQVEGTLPENIRQEVLSHTPDKIILPEYGTTFDYPLIIDGGGYVLGGYQNSIKTVSEKTGTPVVLKLNLPATNLVHLALYTNLAGKSREITDSNTYIIYNKGQPLQKVDPQGLFSSVKFDVDTQGVNNKIQYTIIFAKPLGTSDIIFRAWNDRSSSADVKLHDAWQVDESQSSKSFLQTQDALPQTTVTQTPVQSSWVQDTNMLPAIKDWGGFSSHPISDSEFLSHIGLTGKSIPKWVSSTTKYVVSNDMSQQDFENLVKYLASNGIIK